MKIIIREATTTIDADARELRESNSLAENFSKLLSRCFQSHEPFEDEEQPEEESGESEA